MLRKPLFGLAKRQLPRTIYDALDENDDVYIPQLNWYETANVFRNLIRHNRFSEDETAYFFLMLSFVNFITDFETGSAHWTRI
ncbi:MAG: hypothetical protein LBG94_01275 [Treponema sp.]|nr:hypothetical protein [Treponema sp.]